MERLAASSNNRKTIDFKAIPVHKTRIPTYDKVSIGRPRYRKRSVIRLSTETTRLSMLTAEGGPVSPLPFIPSTLPLSIHPRSGILELFVSNILRHYSPKARWILPGRLRKIGTAVCSQAIRKNYLPTFPSFLPPSVDGTSPRLKENTRVAAASRTSTLFAVFKNLNAFLSLYLHLLSLFLLCAL